MWTHALRLIRERRALLGAEELFNSVTHAIGLGLAALGAFTLVAAALTAGDVWRTAGAAVFGGCLVFLYAASTAYHGVVGPEIKAALRRVDHFGIKLLIAGSYTPFILAHLRGGPGLVLGAIVWGFVALGLVLQLLVPARSYYRLSLVLYLGMGFACVPFLPVVASALPSGALVLLALGGAAYVLGVGFYVQESRPFAHGIWHLFVLAGSALHYAAVFRYVIVDV